MFRNYIEALKFFTRNKPISLIVLVIVVLNAPLKWSMWTFLGAWFLIVFFLSGFLGVVYREKNGQEEQIGIKSIIVEGGLHFAHVILTFAEIIFIMAIDLFIVICFSLLPLLLIGYKKGDTALEYAMLAGLAIIVLIYRLPLLMMAYFPKITTKEFGRYGVVKIKEIVAKNPSIWGHLLCQFTVYAILFAVKFRFEKNPLFFTMFDIVSALMFTVFMMANLYFCREALNKNPELNERYDRYYNGIYKGFIGRFFM